MVETALEVAALTGDRGPVENPATGDPYFSPASYFVSCTLHGVTVHEPGTAATDGSVDG